MNVVTIHTLTVLPSTYFRKWTQKEPSLHRSTEPQAILSDQAECVRLAHHQFRREHKRLPTLRELSDRTDLPVWNVERALVQIALRFTFEEAPKKKQRSEYYGKGRANVEAILAILANKPDGLSSTDIADVMNRPRHLVANYLRNGRDVFWVKKRNTKPKPEDYDARWCRWVWLLKERGQPHESVEQKVQSS